jgi:hypothetical protein
LYLGNHYISDKAREQASGNDGRLLSGRTGAEAVP